MRARATDAPDHPNPWLTVCAFSVRARTAAPAVLFDRRGRDAAQDAAAFIALEQPLPRTASRATQGRRSWARRAYSLCCPGGSVIVMADL